MKITNTVTGIGLGIAGLSFTLEQVTAIVGLVAIIVVIAVNVFAFFNKRVERKSFKAEEKSHIAEKKVHELEAEILQKQLDKMENED